MVDLTPEEKLFLGKLRLMENRTWEDCVDLFEEEFHVRHDWRTLKSKLMAGSWTGLMHQIYETRKKEEIRELYEDLGATELWLRIISTLLVNWQHLIDYSCKAHDDTRLPEAERTYFWTDRDALRLRDMWEQLYSASTQLSAHVRALGPATSDVKILQMFGPENPPMPRTIGGASLDAIAGAVETKTYVEQLIVESQAKLQEIHAKHRAEGRGAFRAIPEDLNDDKDDIFI